HMAYRIGFVMEQTLGHVTHTQNFQQWVERDPDVEPSWIPVSFDLADHWRLAPLVRRNWTLRASLRARARIREILRSRQLDTLFFHTQVTALFAQGIMARIPSVVSMDATPLNFDSIGVPYNHIPSAYPPVEAFKNALTRRTFNAARRLITWHEWGKESLIRDYGVNGAKVAVIPPGINLEKWHFPRSPAPQPEAPLRLLFVGGDFRRKGGDILLAAFRDALRKTCTLDIVTRESLNTEGLDGVQVHRGLGPNAPELMRLYARADVFVFPTFADTLPIVIMEAMASGLPVVTTDVGALSEEVEHGVTGFLVPPHDPRALSEATLRLVSDPGLRLKMAAAARRKADVKFNGAVNYARVLELCKACADAGRI
ncbi:MAG TPA: glycosyltransferase family 4 protein, partial [Bryobacteraceae bacterium]|nr:glycosyltransferase family 4 protein [Bryobacteraceae bacterium]